MLVSRFKLTSQSCGVNGFSRGWRGSPTTPSSFGKFERTSNSQRYVCIRQASRMVNCSQILQVLYVEEERLLGEFKKVCGQILNGTLQIPLLSAGQGCPHHGLHGRWVLWGDEGHLRLPRREVDGGEEQAAPLLLRQSRSGDCSQQGHHDNQVPAGAFTTFQLNSLQVWGQGLCRPWLGTGEYFGSRERGCFLYSYGYKM